VKRFLEWKKKKKISPVPIAQKVGGFTFTHACARTRTHCGKHWHKYKHANTHTMTHKHAHAHAHTLTHTLTHTNLHTYTHTLTHTNIHTYTHTHTHTTVTHARTFCVSVSHSLSHTYIHTHTQQSLSDSSLCMCLCCLSHVGLPMFRGKSDSCSEIRSGEELLNLLGCPPPLPRLSHSTGPNAARNTGKGNHTNSLPLPVISLK